MIALAVPAPDTSRTGEPNSPGELILSRKMPALIINPRIISSSKEKEVREEGCLSVPGIFAEVERSSRVLFEGLVNCKEAITIECAGLLARAIQHEIDHLDGVLFVDRLDRRSFSKLKGKIEEIRRESAKNNFTRERR
jgi:peptide deformylase